MSPSTPFHRAAWPACIGALAVFIAATGHGLPERRSAIGWMIGAWAARLAVQSLYAPIPEVPEWSGFARRATVLFAAPAFIGWRPSDPSLSMLEIVAASLWVLAFAAETTADRKRLRVIPHAHAVCEVAIWCAIALFATASPFGWLAWACPVIRLYLLTPLYSPRS